MPRIPVDKEELIYKNFKDGARVKDTAIIAGVSPGTVSGRFQRYRRREKSKMPIDFFADEKSPCLGCENRDKSKDSGECLQCSKRDKFLGSPGMVASILSRGGISERKESSKPEKPLPKVVEEAPAKEQEQTASSVYEFPYAAKETANSPRRHSSVEDILKRELAYHQDQIKQIQCALKVIAEIIGREG